MYVDFFREGSFKKRKELRNADNGALYGCVDRLVPREM